MAIALHKNWRQLLGLRLKLGLGLRLGLGLVLGACGVALAQIPQGGLSAQGLQLPQALQGAAGGLTGGVGAGGGLGALGLGAPTGIRSADPLPNQLGLNGSGLFQPLEPLKPNDFQKFVLETTGSK